MGTKIFICAAATALLATPVWAADLPTMKAPPVAPMLAMNDIVNANNQISLDFVETYLNYLETDSPSGAKLDAETGWIPGLAVTGSLMRNLFVDNVYLYGQFKWVDGSSHYVGALGGGAFGSFVNTDGAEIFNQDFRIGKGFALTPGFMLTPYLGVGAREWSRNLSGASGYHEDYSNGYVGGGLLAQFSPVSRLVLSANGLIGSTFDASMTASDNPGGFPIPPQTFNLGASTMYMLGASADYAITQNIHINAGVDFDNFHYGKSPVGIGGYLEPNSQTSETTWKVGMGFGF